MNLEEIEVHVGMKKIYNNYPTVPNAAFEEETPKTKGHRDSVIRGFKKRVAMWQTDHQTSLMAEAELAEPILEETL